MTIVDQKVSCFKGRVFVTLTTDSGLQVASAGKNVNGARNAAMKKIKALTATPAPQK